MKLSDPPLQIHRRRPLVRVGARSVRLTPVEHELIVALGMLDNKLATHQLLLDVMTDGCVQIPADQQVLWNRIDRLRRKIGPEHLRGRPYHGYMLVGDVRFVE
jgi:DNA-binding response OmpR family regulator